MPDQQLRRKPAVILCADITGYEQIEDILPLVYEDMGARTLKNIPRPIGAYIAYQ